VQGRRERGSAPAGVVAGVADARALGRRDRPHEPSQELPSADPADERHDLHTGYSVVGSAACPRGPPTSSAGRWLARSVNTTAAGLAQLNRKALQTLAMSTTSVAEIDLRDYPKLQVLSAGQLKALSAKDAGELRKLNLFHAPITDQGFADVRHLVNLQRLHLIGTKLTDKGLAAVQKLDRLEELDLREATNITDAGLVHLAGLKGLKRLMIGETCLTYEKGLIHLKALKQLEKLDLMRTSISEPDLARLKADLPTTKVTWSPATPEGLKTLDRFQKK